MDLVVLAVERLAHLERQRLPPLPAILLAPRRPPGPPPGLLRVGGDEAAVQQLQVPLQDLRGVLTRSNACSSCRYPFRTCGAF